MEYVDGLPVTRFVREQNLSIEERLAVFLKICAAVEVAHHNHVIHRDLKPGNILVNAGGRAEAARFRDRETAPARRASGGSDRAE